MQHVLFWTINLLVALLAFVLGWLIARNNPGRDRPRSPGPSPRRPEPGHVARGIQATSRGGSAAANTEALPSYEILAHLLDGAVVLDRDERIRFINRAAVDYLDLSPAGSLVGVRFRDLVRNLELDRTLRECRQTGRATSAQLDWHKHRRRQLLVQAIPLGSAEASVLLIVRDTTELQRLEQVRRDFVANVSHELKTPLATMVAIVDTLMELPQTDPKAVRGFLGDLRRQVERLYRLVLDLLRLSQLESDAASLEHTELDVAAIGRSVCDELRPLAETQGLTLRTQLDRAVATGDPEGVREIIQNLLDNAIKYTPPGGTVELRVRGDKGTAVIEVADTGIGISRQDQQRIFERFYRVDRNRSRACGGTGLGLAIVKHLVQRMGGWIELESELGRGSTFRVFLRRDRDIDEAPSPQDRQS